MPDRPEPPESRTAGGSLPDPRISSARRRLGEKGLAVQPPAAKPVQVSGIVEQAVEGSLLVLRDQLSGTWFALIGADPAVVRLGQIVTVRGLRTGPDSTIRQQGAALRVEHAWVGSPDDLSTGQ